jgi:hypothetical protein
LGGDNSSFLWCGCLDQEVFNVMVGGIEFDGINVVGGGPVSSCSIVKLCADTPDADCIDFTWEINGVVQNENGPCVEFFLRDCPLNVRLTMESPCGTQVHSQNFDCVDNSPPLSYPINVCIGQEWSLVIPGNIDDLNIHATSGNNVQQSGNIIHFDATSAGPVIMTVTYTVCGATFSRFIYVYVLKCVGFAGNENSPSGSNNKTKDEISVNKFYKAENIDQIKIYPNPVSDVINVQTKFETYQLTVLSADGKVLINSKENNTQTALDIGHLPSGLYYISCVTENERFIEKFFKK